MNLRLILSVVCGYFGLMVPKKCEESSPNKIQAAKLKLKYKKYLSPVKKQVLGKFKLPKVVSKVKKSSEMSEKMKEKEREKTSKLAVENMQWSAKARSQETQSVALSGSSEEIPLSQLKRRLEASSASTIKKPKLTGQFAQLKI